MWAPTWAPTLLASAALGACTLGPDFKAPEPPAAAASAREYTPAPPVAASSASAPGLAGASQELMLGRDIPAQWWSLFHSEPLDQLIRTALARNPNLASAQAALRNAQELYNAQAGALRYPSVGAQLGAERERSTNPVGPGLATYNLFNAGVSVSYTFDMFGANRRTLEGAAAGVDVQRFQTEAAYLTLVSNLVTTAIREASLRAQLQATRDVYDLQSQSLKVVQVQFTAGAVARTLVLAQKTQAAQTDASIPPLEKALAQTRHQLAIYAGQLPSESGLPEFTLESLTLPTELPLSLPSALTRQRPDVRASEALLHQASAQIGVATAAQFPQLNLSGTVGNASFEAKDLFGANTLVWSAAANLTAPLFNGGALAAKKRAAEAAYEQADANYRATVLVAFQNVADALRSLEYDAIALRVQADAESVARQSLDLSKQQYKLGAISNLALLDAQRAYQQTKIALVQAQAARFADTAALLQALGGGWWNRTAVADVSTSASAPATN